MYRQCCDNIVAEMESFVSQNNIRVSIIYKRNVIGTESKNNSHRTDITEIEIGKDQYIRNGCKIFVGFRKCFESMFRNPYNDCARFSTVTNIPECTRSRNLEATNNRENKRGIAFSRPGPQSRNEASKLIYVASEC